MSDAFGIVSTTVASAAAAEELAHKLVQTRLAACVQIMPVRSTYRWKEAVEVAEEHLLLCKIRRADFDEVAQTIRALHGYEMPEIVMAPILGGDPPYLEWLRSSTER